MNTSVSPILALNLMSCTEPVIPTENKNITLNIEEFEEKEEFTPKVEWYIDQRRNSIAVPILKKEYERMIKKNRSTPVKRRKVRNNAYNRKQHNIKQPGRTNCSQRLF